MATKIIFPISGWVAPGFEPVREAFEKNFTRHGEAGAAVHVTVEGAPRGGFMGRGSRYCRNSPMDA